MGKRTDTLSAGGLAIGMVIGVMMGMLLFDNAALGLVFGVAIGMAMESGNSGRKKKKKRQLEDPGED